MYVIQKATWKLFVEQPQVIRQIPNLLLIFSEILFFPTLGLKGQVPRIFVRQHFSAFNIKQSPTVQSNKICVRFLNNNYFTFKIGDDMITGLSCNDLLLNLWKTWLQIVFHERLCLFLVLLTFRHNNL